MPIISENYHACLICKYAIDNNDTRDMCIACQQQLATFLRKMFGVVIGTNLSEQKQLIRNAIDEYFHNKPIISPYDKQPVYYTQLCNEINRQWIGFFTDQHEWIDFKPWAMHVDISDVTKDNAYNIIIRELEKNGIYIYSVFQVITSTGHLGWV